MSLIKQVRMYFQEGTWSGPANVSGHGPYPSGWMADPTGLLNRAHRAGFNAICVPVWDGSGAHWRPVDPTVLISPYWMNFGVGYAAEKKGDPLRLLCDTAERLNMDVFAWFNYHKRNYTNTFPLPYAEFKIPEAQDSFIIGSHPNGVHDPANVGWQDQFVVIVKDCLSNYRVRGAFFDYFRNPNLFYTVEENKAFLNQAWDKLLSMIAQVRGGPENLVVSAYGGHELFTAQATDDSFYRQGRDPDGWILNSRVHAMFGGALGNTTTPFAIPQSSFDRSIEGATVLGSKVDRQVSFVNNTDTGVSGTADCPGSAVNTNLIAAMTTPLGNAHYGGVYLFTRHTDQLSDALKAGVYKENAEPDWSWLY